MVRSNGIAHATACEPEGPEAYVASQQQIKDLTEKIDDVQSSVSTMAVAQATAAGKVDVLGAKFDAFTAHLGDRVQKLEAARSTDEWRAWAERLGYALVGAGALELARQLVVR